MPKRAIERNRLKKFIQKLNYINVAKCKLIKNSFAFLLRYLFLFRYIFRINSDKFISKYHQNVESKMEWWRQNVAFLQSCLLLAICQWGTGSWFQQRSLCYFVFHLVLSQYLLDSTWSAANSRLLLRRFLSVFFDIFYIKTDSIIYIINAIVTVSHFVN